MSQAGASRLAGGTERRQRLRRALLYLVTDDATPAEAVPGLIGAAIEGGVDVVQLRRKGVPAQDLLELASTCRAICHEQGALFIVDDHVEVALRCQADGVHLGQDDIPPAQARERLGDDLLIGLSTHARPEVVAAMQAGVDYISAGPVHATPTKPGRPAVGFEHVEAAAEMTTLPIVAIGGLDRAGAVTAVERGADMVGVVRAICAAADPRLAAESIRRGASAARRWSWIEINGMPRKCRPHEPLLVLLVRLGVDPNAVVVERNGAIAERGSWPDATIEDGDRLELVHFVGGG